MPSSPSYPSGDAVFPSLWLTIVWLFLLISVDEHQLFYRCPWFGLKQIRLRNLWCCQIYCIASAMVSTIASVVHFRQCLHLSIAASSTFHLSYPHHSRYAPSSAASIAGHRRWSWLLSPPVSTSAIGPAFFFLSSSGFVHLSFQRLLTLVWVLVVVVFGQTATFFAGHNDLGLKMHEQFANQSDLGSMKSTTIRLTKENYLCWSIATFFVIEFLI